jgi:hypothetical protein
MNGIRFDLDTALLCILLTSPRSETVQLREERSGFRIVTKLAEEKDSIVPDLFKIEEVK